MLRETPEFSSYQRVYSAIWPAVEELILHLQEICIQYAVPLAVVDGKVRLCTRQRETCIIALCPAAPADARDLTGCV